MNRRHSKLTDWGLKHINIGSRDTILDVGCGGGRTIEKLADIAREGKVYGVDFSEASVAASRKANRQSIKIGRVEVHHASVSQLPFADGMFDLATAVETHFYWPDLLNDLREVQRVLKPGGTLIIIVEAYKGGKYDKLLQRFADAMKPLGFTHLNVDEHRQLFIDAGYVDVQVFEEYDRGWICAMGKKPL
jgi:ubiquinone/menaquinone biosynthesis C-methylase UbiE